jgi:cytochrome c556
LERIGPDARAIQELAGKIASQFPPGSTQSPTAAKLVVWQQWDDFSEKAKKLQMEADKLSKINMSDVNALRSQFRIVGTACDACHETYRVPKGNDR